MLQSVQKSERNRSETGTLKVHRRGDYISDVKHFMETCCALLDVGSDPQALQGVGKMLRCLLADASFLYPAPEVVDVVSPVRGSW